MASRGGVGTVQARRRNGKQQACEPCRKAKIACDHSLPTCDRCRRRKVTEKCVYLAAPMIRPTGSVTAPSGIEIERKEERHPLPTPSVSAAPSIASPALSATQIFKEVRSPVSSGPFIKSGGFFGPTNFSAVFLENRDNLVSGNEEMQISNDSEDPPPPSASLQSQTFLMLAGGDCKYNPRVELGTKVLRALPNKNTCNFLLEWFYEKCHECIFFKHTVMSCAKSLWQTHGSFLGEPKTTENLHRISVTLCKNSTMILEEPDGSGEYHEWLDSFTGSNMRWETIGIVFSCLVTATLSLPERDGFFCTQRGDRRDRKLFAVEMKDCIQACITLSNWKDFINLPMVCLLAKNLVLQTVISGDTSLIVWRQLGDLISSSTALGLHRQIPTEQPVSFFVEMKKKVFTFVFNIDKETSVLTGRPPSLSYRYTRFKIPFDLSDDVLIAGGEELINAVSNLDKDGWNREGKIHPATTCRAHGILSVILNEILELSLGEPSDCTEEKTKLLIARLQTTYNDFPSYLHFSLHDPSNAERSDHAFWKSLCTRNSFLEHLLLLERIGYKQGWLDGQNMVDVATEMLELTVSIWVQRDRFVQYHQDFDWMLMVWGVPSSGVLCVELLKQLKNPGDSRPKLKRSEIVQNLSLLIGFLEVRQNLALFSYLFGNRALGERSSGAWFLHPLNILMNFHTDFSNKWVRPAAGNYQLCSRMRLIIKRILDQILDPSPPSSAPIQQSSNSGLLEPMDTTESGTLEFIGPFDTAVPQPGAFDLSSYENGVDNLDWLNSIDWSRGPWIDIGQDFAGLKWSGGF